MRDVDSGEMNMASSQGETLPENSENNPTYERVDDARRKVSQLMYNGGKDASSRPVSSPVHLVQFPPVENGVLSSLAPAYVSKAEIISEQRPNHISNMNTVSGARRWRVDHDYEEVDLSPTSPNRSFASPHLSPHIQLHNSHFNPQMSSSVSTSFVSSTTSAEQTSERFAENHLYEELSDVRNQTRGIANSRLPVGGYKRGANRSRSSASESDSGRKSSDDKKQKEKGRNFSSISHTRL